MQHVNRTAKSNDIHHPIGITIEALSQFEHAGAELRSGLQSSGIRPSCTCRSLWPKDTFTGDGRPEMSSLLLPIQTIGLDRTVAVRCGLPGDCGSRRTIIGYMVNLPSRVKPTLSGQIASLRFIEPNGISAAVYGQLRTAKRS